MIISSTDSAFRIGATHRVCEDYACSYINGVILADGCSTAAYTDIGARVLARHAVKYLHRYPITTAREIVRSITDSSLTTITDLGLPRSSLSATLLTAHVHNNQVYIHRFGDGVIAWKYKNQPLMMDIIHFSHEAPYYPKYDLNNGERHEYLRRFGEDWRVHFTRKTYNAGIPTLNPPDKHVIFEDIYDLPTDTIWEDMPSYSLPIKHLEYVAIMSDGVDQFNASDKRVPIVDIANELLSFKTTQGKFVQRRFNKAFKLFAEREWINLDDVSIAAIAFNEQ